MASDIVQRRFGDKKAFSHMAGDVGLLGDHAEFRYQREPCLKQYIFFKDDRAFSVSPQQVENMRMIVFHVWRIVTGF